MSTLLVRNLPESLHRSLKERAKRNRRSVAQEVLVLLEEALAVEEDTRLTSAPEPFAGKISITDEWLAAARREGRA